MNEFLSENAIVIGLLLMAALLLAVIYLIIVLIRREHLQQLEIVTDVEAAIKNGLIGASNEIKQFHDVVAIQDLMKSLDAQPDALEKIKSYPAQVQAACWLHYTDTLGTALKVAQEQLRRAHNGEKFNFTYGTPQSEIISHCQARVDLIRGKLTAAIKASDQPLLHAV